MKFRVWEMTDCWGLNRLQDSPSWRFLGWMLQRKLDQTSMKMTFVLCTRLPFVGLCPGSHRTGSWGHVHCLFVETSYVTCVNMAASSMRAQGLAAPESEDEVVHFQGFRLTTSVCFTGFVATDSPHGFPVALSPQPFLKSTVTLPHGKKCLMVL